MANSSGADLELASLIRRAGFDPSDPTVYKFGVALLEQLADERDLLDIGNWTTEELVAYFHAELASFAYVDPEDSDLLVVPISESIYVDPEDSGLLVFAV